MVRTSRPLYRCAVLAMALAACTSSSGSTIGTPSSVRSSDATVSPASLTTPSPSPTPPAIPEHLKTHGATSPKCVHGWFTPAKANPLYREPLGVIRRTTGVSGPLVVVDMRYFTGPESPPGLSSGKYAKGYLAVIQRWYVKLYARDDLSFQGRFLVESRVFGRGLSAVAPYDTKGYESPDWRGFQYDSGDTVAKTYPGLPGTWAGVEYDFVKGGAGLDLPGLPSEVVGCLRGT